MADVTAPRPEAPSPVATIGVRVLISDFSAVDKAGRDLGAANVNANHETVL
jgi:hypothetical protein